MGYRPDFDTVVAGLASKQSAVAPVLLQNHRAVNPGLFRVWFTGVDGRNLEIAAAEAGLSAALGERFSTVAGSVTRRVADSRVPVYSGLVQPNKGAQPYTAETASTMRTVVEANLFADAEDVMWRKVEADGTEWLVQVSQEDHDGMLRQRRRSSVQPVLAALEEDRNSSGVQVGEFCSYYHTPSQSLRAGFLIRYNGQLTVASDAALVPVSEDLVVASSREAVLPEETADLRGDAQKIIDYFKQIYGENTPLMARLRQLLRTTG